MRSKYLSDGSRSIILLDYDNILKKIETRRFYINANSGIIFEDLSSLGLEDCYIDRLMNRTENEDLGEYCACWYRLKDQIRDIHQRLQASRRRTAQVRA